MENSTKEKRNTWLILIISLLILICASAAMSEEGELLIKVIEGV